jgi:hypothetical protein
MGNSSKFDNFQLKCCEYSAYSTVPATASVPAYGASALQDDDKESSNIEAPCKRRITY